MDEIFYKIFDEMPRLGPGSDAATLKALSLTEVPEKNAEVLDIGCGTGAQTLVLASNISGRITALDNHQPYLDTLKKKFVSGKYTAELEYICNDMNKAEFPENSFDLIWAEGSVYIMGFEKALKLSAKALKKGGYAVFSDMNRISDNPPEEAVEFFGIEYPEMMTVSDCKELIGKSKLTLRDCFILDADSHLDNYYIPLQNRLEIFRNEYKNDVKVKELLLSLQNEIDVYIKYYEHFSYCYYIMQK